MFKELQIIFLGGPFIAQILDWATLGVVAICQISMFLLYWRFSRGHTPKRRKKEVNDSQNKVDQIEMDEVEV